MNDDILASSEVRERMSLVYEFLAGYKQNSGIFINNFLRGFNFEQYSKGKFDSFELDVHGGIPNMFDNELLSIEMVSYLGKLDDAGIAYFPIDINYIDRLIALCEVMEYFTFTEEDTVLYRGCSDIETDGTTGLISTTTDKRVAEQFSRGTILMIHVPKGTKYLDINALRRHSRNDNDFEKEILLPPCEYEVLKEETIKRGNEPNNLNRETRIIEINVKPIDLLAEFLKKLENPPKEYALVMAAQGQNHFMTINYLKQYIQDRKKKL